MTLDTDDAARLVEELLASHNAQAVEGAQQERNDTSESLDAGSLPALDIVETETPGFSILEPRVSLEAILPEDIVNERPVGKPVIVFDQVSKVYPAQPNKPALANISLEVFAGEFMFLVGHSGSGKSTFIRLINREIRPTSGKLMVAGENLTRMRGWRVPYLRRNIGCVYQDYKLLPDKTAFQNVAFALEVIGKSRHIIRTQVPEVLRLVGLEDKLNMVPDQLSGGEQQRVCIARAIVNRPPLLVCDEPTGNLDPQTSLGIMRLLDRINRTGTTVLVATHDREMVDSMRKRVVALENGYLVRDQDRGVYGLDA
ncbi:MAG: cell division ATP-binding protein FtsE [Coriobacteriales bacterium]|nr:cell division ATP-binding protein FtsE [Coriobacteriales bacterium]